MRTLTRHLAIERMMQPSISKPRAAAKRTPPTRYTADVPAQLGIGQPRRRVSFRSRPRPA